MKKELIYLKTNKESDVPVMAYKFLEEWLLDALPPDINVEIEDLPGKKRFYFFNGEKALGMIEILIQD